MCLDLNIPSWKPHEGPIPKVNTRAERETKRAEKQATNQKLRRSAEKAAGVDPEYRKPIDRMTKREVWKAGCCAVCGRKPPEVVLVIDHIRPVASFPPGDHSYNEIENLRLLCTEHNALKGASRDFAAEQLPPHVDPPEPSEDQRREAKQWRDEEDRRLMEKLGRAKVAKNKPEQLEKKP